MTKILLVEDDKSLREIYGVRLLAEGYDIVSAGDGEQALAMAIKERPQLIISDVMMPKISGFDMLDILRSTTETKDIKVVMMTALSSEDQRARGEALGADRYLVKSQVGIEDVVRTIHEVLGDAPVTGSTSQAFGAPTPSAAPRSAPSPVPPRPNPVAAAAPAPRPTPAGPQPSTPSEPQSGMPRPTAPFSTTRPAGLGERIIHPISQPTGSQPDLGSLMDQELNSAPAPTPPPLQNAAPSAPPMAAPLPPAPPTPPSAQPMQQPTTEQVSPMTPPSQPPATAQPTSDPDISFEETPRPTGPFTPSSPPPAV